MFEIDNYGVTVCRSHSEFSDKSLAEPLNLKYINLVRIHLLPQRYKFCKTCSHYYDNDCYLPSEQIDKAYKQRGILLGLFFNKFKCDICGHQIGNIFLILRDWYLKQKYNRSDKLICTTCQNNIINGTLKSQIRFYILFNLILLLIIGVPGILISILLFYVSSNLPQYVLSFVFFGMILIFSSVLLIRLIKYTRYKRVAPVGNLIKDEKMIKKKRHLI